MHVTAYYLPHTLCKGYNVVNRVVVCVVGVDVVCEVVSDVFHDVDHEVLYAVLTDVFQDVFHDVVYEVAFEQLLYEQNVFPPQALTRSVKEEPELTQLGEPNDRYVTASLELYISLYSAVESYPATVCKAFEYQASPDDAGHLPNTLLKVLITVVS